MRLQEYIQKNNLEKILYSKEDWKFEVCSLVTEARLRAGLTQAELAKKMKTKQPSIARVEGCKILPSIEFLVKLAKAIGTELELPKFRSVQAPEALISENTSSSKNIKEEVDTESIFISRFKIEDFSTKKFSGTSALNENK